MAFYPSPLQTGRVARPLRAQEQLSCFLIDPKPESRCTEEAGWSEARPMGLLGAPDASAEKENRGAEGKGLRQGRDAKGPGASQGQGWIAQPRTFSLPCPVFLRSHFMFTTLAFPRVLHNDCFLMSFFKKIKYSGLD